MDEKVGEVAYYGDNKVRDAANHGGLRVFASCWHFYLKLCIRSTFKRYMYFDPKSFLNDRSLIRANQLHMFSSETEFH